MQAPEDYRQASVQIGGIRLAYFERGVEYRGKAPSLLFVHATGFHARIWDRVAGAFPSHHIIALDQRGHGRSDKRQVRHWQELVQDLTEFVIALDLTNLVGIGHSMGGHAVIGAASAEERRFLRLIAIDPVISAAADYGQRPHAGFTPETFPVAKRRRDFASPEEMAERLRPKGSFGLFHPEVLMDYCRHGLLPKADGAGYTLACPPEVEASIYLASRSHKDIHDAVRSLRLPVLVVRAKEPPPNRELTDFSSSPTWPGLAAEFRNARDRQYPDMTHFLPMQAPAEAARLIHQELQASKQDGV